MLDIWFSFSFVSLKCASQTWWTWSRKALRSVDLLTVFTPAWFQKLMALMNPKNEDEDEEEDVTRMQTDVTDEEMALR